MAKLNQYRECVQRVLQEYSQYRPAYGDIVMQLLFDTERDHYQLLSVGWNGLRRVHGSIIHIDIINEQIWIQHDGTEGGIANDVVELGVPKEDIVLGFHAPYKRQYTGFDTGIEATHYSHVSQG